MRFDVDSFACSPTRMRCTKYVASLPLYMTFLIATPDLPQNCHILWVLLDPNPIRDSIFPFDDLKVLILLLGLLCLYCHKKKKFTNDFILQQSLKDWVKATDLFSVDQNTSSPLLSRQFFFLFLKRHSKSLSFDHWSVLSRIMTEIQLSV